MVRRVKPPVIYPSNRNLQIVLIVKHTNKMKSSNQTHVGTQINGKQYRLHQINENYYHIEATTLSGYFLFNIGVTTNGVMKNDNRIVIDYDGVLDISEDDKQAMKDFNFDLSEFIITD